jgi:hypothetical protein
MKTKYDTDDSPLKFNAYGQPMYITAQCVNHGLCLPVGKVLLERGLFILGNLETDRGRKIEAAKRIVESFDYYCCALEASESDNFLPFRVFPRGEHCSEIEVPEDLFNPAYNCHGHTFAHNEYWINPLASISQNGVMTPINPNVDIILEDEYIKVDYSQNWDIAVFRNYKNEILHSILNQNGIITSKYDSYKKISCDDIKSVDTSVYGKGKFEFYRRLSGI